MYNFQISLSALLKKMYDMDPDIIHTAQRMTFFESLEKGWIHYVPRLLIMESGSCIIEYVRNGVAVSESIKAPAIFYCAKDGWLKITAENEQNREVPNKTFSFSFYPTYIRAMHIDFDGIKTPPTDRDIYYHTNEPLSEAGQKVIEALELLNRADRNDIGTDLLVALYKITLNDLEKAGASSNLGDRIPRLWSKINTYMREHRNEPFSREDVAKIFTVSAPYVSELCKKYTGESFSELKLRYQLAHAANLLLNTRLQVGEIAEMSGFSCANYFIRRFKKVYGKTPHVYRNDMAEK